MLPIIGWVMLWFRPSWGFLLFFGLCIGVFSLGLTLFLLISAGVFDQVSTSELFVALASDFVVNVGVFAAVGAIIVAARGGKIERKPTEKEIDEELARFRAAKAEGTTSERAQVAAAIDAPIAESQSADAGSNGRGHGLMNSMRSALRSGPVRLWIVASIAIWSFGLARLFYNEGWRTYWTDYLGDYWPYWVTPFGLGALMLGVRWVRDGYGNSRTPKA
jgi:hypothetical protein